MGVRARTFVKNDKTQKKRLTNGRNGATMPTSKQTDKFRGKAESIHEEAEQRNDDDVHVHVPHVHVSSRSLRSETFWNLFNGLKPNLFG